MADAGRRRDDAEVVERLLAPAQERVALAVALVVAVGVDVEGARVAEGVDLDRVVDDQVDRDQRVDPVGARRRAPPSRRASRPGRRAPGTPVKSCIRTRAGWNGISVARLGRWRPSSAIVSMWSRGDRLAVLEPQRVLEQDLDRVGKPGDVVATTAGRRAGRSRTRCRRPPACRGRRSCRCSRCRLLFRASSACPPCPSATSVGRLARRPAA